MVIWDKIVCGQYTVEIETSREASTCLRRALRPAIGLIRYAEDAGIGEATVKVMSPVAVRVFRTKTGKQLADVDVMGISILVTSWTTLDGVLVFEIPRKGKKPLCVDYLLPVITLPWEVKKGTNNV